MKSVRVSHFQFWISLAVAFLWVSLTSEAWAQGDSAPDSEEAEIEAILGDEPDTLTDEDNPILETEAPRILPQEESVSSQDAPEEYVIQTGDTLWDICDKFMGNPWYWPKLWSLNEYIKNPHLIYPGDRLRFYGGSLTQAPQLDVLSSGQKAPEVAEAAPGIEPEAETTQTRSQESQIILEPKKEGVLIQNLSFIYEKPLKGIGVISHSGEEKMVLSFGDRVYLDINRSERDNVKVGDRYHVIRNIKEVDDPDSIFGGFGTLVKRKAVVRVTAIHEKTVEGVVAENVEFVQRGDRLVPYVETAKRVIPNKDSERKVGKIVEADREQYLIGDHDIVFVNLGKNRGVKEGTELYVVRRGDGMFPGSDRNLPEVVVGKLLIVEPGNKTSSAYVTSLVKGLEIGDTVTTVVEQ